ncbi:MAG: glycosyltransferase family 2 protein [Candidatus Hodarchaeales archaeon]|jgi:cellulose synthase/poly-beta-1,6-N-acetylglucosamine synthase-like glycosyltransferase
MDLILALILSLNLVSALIIIPYPINLLFLTISSVNWKDPIPEKKYSELELPSVTIQLPIYNESKIIEKTLANLENIVYPLDRLKFQILDDSTDSTSRLIDMCVTKLKKKGLTINIVRRSTRNGFKAGALRNGLDKDDSEFVALFDSDFVINPEFLMKCIHFFKDRGDVGAVQARWGHSNLSYSIFTRSMSIGLDGHFLVEKIGRKSLNANITFNGTGGVWRRVAIDTSGGWSSDTLAEDLDLAYRAQMSGFQIFYLKNLINNQEIPPNLRSWIIQQSRWSRGFSQNIKKNLPSLLFSTQRCSIMCKIQGVIHLTQYLIPLMILINTTTGTILIFESSFNTEIFSVFGILFAGATLCGIIAYSFGIIRSGRPTRDIFLIPLFLFWGGGLIVRMGVGTLTGFMKKGGEFERTPKYNLSEVTETSPQEIHDHISLDRYMIFEVIYMLILILGFVKYCSIGVFYLFNALYLLFLSLGLLNLIFSEIFHAFSS